MDETVGNFVAAFHNLDGITVSEKKKNLFQLFRENSALHNNETLLDNIALHLHADTHLERIFLVDFLIYFRRFHKLIQEFNNGDDIVLSKIAKQNWFFQRAFSEVGVEFVDLVLPTLSFALRLKVLKKLCMYLTEAQSDQIFDALLNRYGIFIATNILTSCSINKIEQILKSYPIELWHCQLKLLYNKDPALICLYLSERVKNEGNRNFMNHNPIFVYIAQKNPKMYCDLKKQYNFEMFRLGKRTTKKFVTAHKDEIIAKPTLYISNLRPDRFVRKMGPDFGKILVQIFYSKIWNSNYEALRFLKYYPRKGQYSLYLNAFRNFYNKQPEEDLKNVDENLLKMITDSSEREKLAKLKFEKENNKTYLAYYKAENCISIIKGMFKVLNTSSQRSEGVTVLAHTCIVNNDYDAFLTVCKFVCKRLRNDPCALQAFVNMLIRESLNFAKLEEEHWYHINEILAKLNYKNWHPWNFRIIKLKYLQFLVEKGKPIKEELPHFIENHGLSDNIKSIRNKPKFEKSILSGLLEVGPEDLPKSETIENFDCQVLVACKEYNSRHPSNAINIFNYARLLQSVKSALINKTKIHNNALVLGLEPLLCTNLQTGEIEELRQLYWNSAEIGATAAIIMWFLRHKPQLVASNPEKLVPSVTNLNSELVWRLVKCYSHLQLDQKTVELFISKLSDEDFELRRCLISPLSFMMEPEDYLKLAETYLPTSDKAEGLVGLNTMYEIRRNFAFHIKHLRASDTAWPIILKFCVGDYLPSGLSSLQSFLYRIPENRVKVFIDEVGAKGAISVKKHALYMICVIFDKRTVTDTLKSSKLDKSLGSTLRYFRKNPSDELWEILKIKLPTLDKNDLHTSLLVVNAVIWQKYKACYFECAWEVLHSTQNKFKNVLLTKLSKDTIPELRIDFCADMIENSLFEMDAMNKFVSNFLIHHNDSTKFSVLLRSLDKFKKNKWASKEGQPRKTFSDFIDAFAAAYMAWDGCDENLIVNFLAMLEQVFLPIEVFEEFVVIFLMKFKNQSIENLGKSVVELNHNLISRYDKLAIPVIADGLRKSLKHFFKHDAKHFELYSSLLQHKQSVNDVLLVIKALPVVEPEDGECRKSYDDILSELRGMDDEIVQLHLNLYSKSIRTETRYTYY